MAGPVRGSSITRTERKEPTRRAILNAALELSAKSSLSALSLRQVAREAGIAPNGLYRHFASATDLGLALVEESFGSLRTVLGDVQENAEGLADAMNKSVDLLVQQVGADSAEFGFICRERVGGVPEVRAAIRHELTLFEADIATEFARLPGSVNWSTQDLKISANLIVTALVAAAERLLDSPDAAGEIAHVARQQMKMLTIGARQWKS